MAKDFDKFLASLGSRVSGITDDSRKVKKGFAFVAIKGLTSDGHLYIDQARELGARFIVGERGKVDYKVKDSRKAISLLASAWYKNPSKHLKLIGVTGTDGKTTTASLIYWILKTAGERVGLISTVSAKIGDKNCDTGLHVTNPEPLELQRLLSLMTRKKCKYAVLEVTSHGLDQDRVYGVNFDIGVLTNVTHEHLDYHKTFANYLKAKKKLFGQSKLSIVNKRYSKYFGKGSNRFYYDFLRLDDSLRHVVTSKFIEPYNWENSAAAILTAKKLGVSELEVARAIESFPGVKGRMQNVRNARGIKIIIDFAHTPNALKNVLAVLKKQLPAGKKLIAVFGCAGERDVKKRPMMAKVSTDIADISVFTAEDPRSEKIESIFLQMEAGIKRKSIKIYKIPDRKKAISFSLNKLAKRGDVVVICGKGHERSMNINGVEEPWSDLDVVQNCLRRSKGRTLFSKLTTFGVGGKIDRIVKVQNEGNLSLIAPDLMKKKSPVFILGGGSDILVSDKPFNGTVLKYIGKGFKIEGNRITAEAGMEWDDLVDECVKRNLQGVECLSGIPGTVGGAPIQNIGAYGQELKDVFVKLRAFDLIKMKFVTFSRSQCKFGYRESIFKSKKFWQRFLITSVTLQLQKSRKPEVRYDSLKEYLRLQIKRSPNLKEVRKAVLTIRSGKFEDPKKVGNAGSFFKNPLVSKVFLSKLITKFPDIKYIRYGNKFKIFAGWLIEKSGWKGKKYKTAAVSPNHSLILINPYGRAKAVDIFELSKRIASDVKRKFGVTLEREVQIINF